MAEVGSAVPEVLVQPPSMTKPTAEAAGPPEAVHVVSPTVPMHMSALSERALAVRTPSPLGEQSRQRSQRQLGSSTGQHSSSKPPSGPKRRFACCTRPAVLYEGEQEDGESVGSNQEQGSLGSLGSSPLPSQQHKKSHWESVFSPKKSLRAQALTQQGSIAYSDAEW